MCVETSDIFILASATRGSFCRFLYPVQQLPFFFFFAQQANAYTVIFFLSNVALDVRTLRSSAETRGLMINLTGGLHPLHTRVPRLASSGLVQPLSRGISRAKKLDPADVAAAAAACCFLATGSKRMA